MLLALGALGAAVATAAVLRAPGAWQAGWAASGLAAVLAAAAVAGWAGRRRLQRQAEDVSAQARLRDAVLAGAQEILLGTDPDGRLTYLSPNWSQYSGRPVQSALARPLRDLFEPADAASVDALLAADGPPGARRSRVRLRQQGDPGRPVELTVHPLTDPDLAPGFTASARDLTEVQTARTALGAQLAFVDSLLETSPLPLSVLDTQGRYLRVNRSWERFTGRRREDVIGTAAAGYLPPEEAARHDRMDARLLAEGGVMQYEAPFRAPDGPDHDLMITKSVVRDDDGRPTAIVCAFMDVTEFRSAERLTRRAREAAEELLRTRAEFVANMSHELRTPLQSILGFSELGLRRSDPAARTHGMFVDIHRAGERMLALVNDLLDLAKLEGQTRRLDLRREDLRDLVRETVHEFDPLLPARGLEIDVDLPPAPLVARVDAPRLQQVLRNVLANAVRFSPAQGRIGLQLRAEPGPPGSSGEVRIEIADRGPGIPAAELERIFDAFVQSSRTKDGAGGTGLGLAISREILRAHDGRISARNRDGGGSVFEIALPAAGFGDTVPADL